MNKVKIIGGGFAGVEAAWQLAERGIETELYEMKPLRYSPAHSSEGLAELVCSNSFKATRLGCAAGMLKAEMELLGSLCVECAKATAVPAGGALAVDRDKFSALVTEKILSRKEITLVREEVTEIPDGVVIIAAGPLASPALSERIRELCGGSLSFFDAAAPIVTAESIDLEHAFMQSRYDRGEPDDYINCPMEKDEYLAFWHALCEAEGAPVHDFEDKRVFEGCMPVETMARRGEDTLRFGPLKPVGLINPHTGALPYAVVQLRRDNTTGTVYNMVGFQTHLKFGEQKRVFGMIPGLENAEFLRYGVMHRNSYLDSPRLLDGFYRARKDPRVSFAGQFTGVEGYVESAASGLYAGATAAIELLTGRLPEPLPRSTATGALAAYVSNPAVTEFQPMNVNFGIIDGSGVRAKGKQARLEAIADRALATVSASAFAAENVR